MPACINLLLKVASSASLDKNPSYACHWTQCLSIIYDATFYIHNYKHISMKCYVCFICIIVGIHICADGGSNSLYDSLNADDRERCDILA